MQTYDIIGIENAVLGQVEATTKREAINLGRQRYGEMTATAQIRYAARPMTGNGLKAFREERNLTQDQFCERIGLSRRSLTNYEAYYERPIPKVVALACRAISERQQPMPDPA